MLNLSSVGQQQPVDGDVSGKPVESSGRTFRIRCAPTKTSAKPIVLINQEVVDYSRLETIDPKTIDSIIVLRGTAAAALFGVRGTNGAIFIFTRETTVKVKPVQQERISLNLYPNPAPAGTQLIASTSASLSGTGTVRIFDLQGRQLSTQTLPDMQNAKNISIKTNSFNPGAYVLQINTTSGTTMSTRFIIQ